VLQYRRLKAEMITYRLELTWKLPTHQGEPDGNREEDCPTDRLIAFERMIRTGTPPTSPRQDKKQD